MVCCDRGEPRQKLGMQEGPKTKVITNVLYSEHKYAKTCVQGIHHTALFVMEMNMCMNEYTNA